MAFEEEAAYAVAAWQRLDSAVSDELLRAVTGAFALIAVADGDLAQSEVNRFMALIRERSALLPGLDLDRIEGLFRDVSAALLSDPESGKERALTYVAAVKGNASQCDLVRSAAEIAMLADGRSLDNEDALLQQICATLGIASRL